MKTLLIIPTYNEAENLSPLLQEIFSYAPLTHVLIVDDHSPDGTGELADNFQKNDARVHVLHRAGKLGLGTAYLAGFKFALAHGYDAAFEMDADFSHDPRYLEPMLAAARDSDMVLGSRYVEGGGVENWGLFRRLISRGGGLYARIVLGVPIHDLTGGFKCIHRRVLETIQLETVRAEGYVFQIEVTYRALLAGFRVTEVPIVFRDRSVGSSKMSTRIAAEAIWAVPLLRFSARSAMAGGKSAPSAIRSSDDG